jgi:hypothetical protein
MRRSIALVTFVSALVASVATSPRGWRIEAYEEGAPWGVSTEFPEASLDVVVQGDAEALAEAWGGLDVSVRVTDLVPADDTPVTLDFVLYEAGEVEREVAATRGWTLGPETEDDPTPEVVTLSADDVDPNGEWRVEITLVGGAAAEFEWSARAWFDYEGEAAHPGDDAVVIDLNPMVE